MRSEITLKKGRLSTLLLNTLCHYYDRAGMSTEYVTACWHRWTGDTKIVKYVAHRDGVVQGWVVYDPTRSTIEELVTTEEVTGKGEIEAEIVDALVGRESLVSAEIAEMDREKRLWMEEYGFRPTRHLRRGNFACVRMDLSIRVLLEKVRGKAPATPYEKKEVVAVERVPASRSHEELKQGLLRLLASLGGLSRFVKPGQSVVIKPNLISDHGLVGGVYKGGIVTDLSLVTALIDLLLPVAARITIAEGSSINRSETARQFSLYGYDTLVEMDRSKVTIVDLNTDRTVEKRVPAGKRMASRAVPVTLEEADVIINVPVLKTHMAAVVSLAVKSLQGTMPPMEKYMSHFFGLWQNLVNIHHVVKPRLHIIDALTGQEGFGPVSGTEKRLDLLIAGANPVAVDAVAMRIMGLSPQDSPPVCLAYMQGLGPIEEEKIEVAGPPISELVDPFALPEIDLRSGTDFLIHDGNACPGCRGYLHFGVTKLRRPDPADPTRLLIDRPMGRKINFFMGPETRREIDPAETNVFVGTCQQHHADRGIHLPGCPPHAEVIINGVFRYYPDVVRPKYSDESEEAKLERMLKELIERQG